MDDGESHDGVEVGAFPSLEKLDLYGLPNLERLLKVERGEMFPCLFSLNIERCSNLVLPCLPYVEYLSICDCDNIELLRSISSLYGLITLDLVEHRDMTSFPEGMLRNLTCLQTLEINTLSKLKELPNELFNLATLENLEILACDELESLPEQGWQGLRSLRTMHIFVCEGLRSLPEGMRHLTSLEVLAIHGCQALKERCKKGTGEDWDKIAHIPILEIE